MKTVMRGNKQLRVADDRLESMLQAGYAEIDEQGNPIHAPEAKDDKALKKENAALKKENKELIDQVAALTQRVAELDKPAE